MASIDTIYYILITEGNVSNEVLQESIKLTPTDTANDTIKSFSNKKILPKHKSPA